MNILRLAGMFIDPLMGAHVAHSMKMGPIFNGDSRCADIADQDALFQDLNFLRRCDGSVDFPAGHESASGNNPFDDGKLAHDERAARVDFTFEFAVDADGAVEIDDPFELHAFPEKGKVVIV